MSEDATHGPSPAETHDLRGRVVRAFGWNMTAQVVRQGTRLAYGVAIAHLVTPRQYGLAGMALVFASLGLVFSDLGFGAALVQRRKVTERDRSTVFWTSVVIGSLMTVTAFFLAGPIASFYGQPSVKPLVQLMSVTFVLGALGMTQAAILQRALDYRSLELRIMGAVLAAAVVTVALAAAGFGSYALIANQLVLATVSTALMWTLSPWRPRWTFSRRTIKDFGPFSSNLVGKSVLDYAGRNSDNILVGRYLGSSQLGAYSAAYNIMLLPLENMVQPIVETLFPALSRMQDDPARLARVWIRVTRVMLALIGPAMLGLVVVAPDFVPTVLGHRWEHSIPIIEILAPVAVLQAMSRVGMKTLTALGRTRLLFRFSLVFYPCCLAAFVVGLRWGIAGVAGAYAIVNVPLQAFLLASTARALQTRIFVFARSLGGAALAAMGTMASAEAVRLFLVSETGTPRAIRLVLTIVAGVAAYVPLCAAWVPEVREEMKVVLSHRARRDKPRFAAPEGAAASRTL
jgi:O-antigen/teichoic acid export membrane protein